MSWGSRRLSSREAARAWSQASPRQLQSKAFPPSDTCPPTCASSDTAAWNESALQPSTTAEPRGLYSTLGSVEMLLLVRSRWSSVGGRCGAWLKSASAASKTRREGRKAMPIAVRGFPDTRRTSIASISPSVWAGEKA